MLDLAAVRLFLIYHEPEDTRDSQDRDVSRWVDLLDLSGPRCSDSGFPAGARVTRKFLHRVSYATVVFHVMAFGNTMTSVRSSR